MSNKFVVGDLVKGGSLFELGIITKIVTCHSDPSYSAHDIYILKCFNPSSLHTTDSFLGRDLELVDKKIVRTNFYELGADGALIKVEDEH